MSAALWFAVAAAVVLGGAVCHGLAMDRQAAQDCLERGVCSPVTLCRLAPPPPERADWILRDGLDPCDDAAVLAHFGGAP